MNRLQPASQLKLAVPLPRREGFYGPFRQHRRMIKCPQVGDSGRSARSRGECPILVDSGPYGMPGERSASVPRRTRTRDKPARLTAFSALATHRRGVSLPVSISIPADAL